MEAELRVIESLNGVVECMGEFWLRVVRKSECIHLRRRSLGARFYPLLHGQRNSYGFSTWCNMDHWSMLHRQMLTLTDRGVSESRRIRCRGL